MIGRAALLGLIVLAAGPPAPAPSGWGLNSRMVRLAPGPAAAELRRLQAGRLVYLREDVSPDAADWPRQRANLEKMQRTGYRVVGLIPYGIGRAPDDPRDVLVEDLRAVYAAAFSWERTAGGLVPVWENYNEPDTKFCRDLPDRSTAYIKAVYLGLKAASKGQKPVLLPAMSGPPGPWLERAVANGLLNYGDAMNFHYYGHPDDFSAFIRLSRGFMRGVATSGRQRRLPFWITETGLEATRPGDPDGREMQADYFRETARVAADSEIAAFMPYAFRDDDAGFALMRPDGTPYPAWPAYVQETRARSLAPDADHPQPPSEACPVILQWLPDAGACLPDKVSGTYQFAPSEADRDETITGTVWLYNFSDSAVQGRLSVDGLAAIGLRMSARCVGHEFSIPAQGRVKCRVIFSTALRGFVRESVRFRWTDAASGQVSPLVFGLQTMPRDRDFIAAPFAVSRPERTASGYHFPWIDEPASYHLTTASGPWIGIDGLDVRERNPSAPEGVFALNRSFARSAGPAMAVARVNGLPDSEFLRITADRVLGVHFKIGVDLVDGRGRRFTISENTGVNYFQPSRQVWLNWNDFHLEAAGRLGGRVGPLRPATVRQIELRFYADRVDAPLRVKLEAMRPRNDRG
jgi:hypothetical protein